MADLVKIAKDKLESQDFASGIAYYIMASDQGYIPAILFLGDHYVRNKCIKNALDYYKQGVELQDIECTLKYAKLVEEHKDTLNKDSYDLDYISLFEKVVTLFAMSNMSFTMRDDEEEAVDQTTTIDIDQDNDQEIIDEDKVLKMYIRALSKLLVNSYRNSAERASFYLDSITTKAKEYPKIEGYCLRKVANFHFETCENPEKAWDMYKRAVDMGDIKGYVKLGDMCMIKKLYDMAINFYESACKGGCYVAADKLAEYYKDKENYDMMLHYLSVGCEHNNLKSFIKIAKYNYQIGNSDTAELYYLMAANQGSSKAMINVADYYQQTNNKTRAIDFYTMAYNNGHIDGGLRLASIFMESNRYDKAEEILSLIISDPVNGVEHPEIIGEAYFNMGKINLSKRDYVLAKANYLAAADNSYCEAYKELAEIYRFEGNEEEADTYINFYNENILLEELEEVYIF